MTRTIMDMRQHRDPWCRWFPGLFNTTWAVYDQQHRVLWLLAITDMD